MFKFNFMKDTGSHLYWPVLKGGVWKSWPQPECALPLCCEECT